MRCEPQIQLLTIAVVNSVRTEVINGLSRIDVTFFRIVRRVVSSFGIFVEHGTASY